MITVKKTKNGLHLTTEGPNGEKLTLIKPGSLYVFPLSALPPEMQKALELEAAEQKAKLKSGATK